MDDADAVSLQNVHVALRHRDAVRRRRGRIERAERFEPLRRRFAVALDALALLARCLGEVDVDEINELIDQGFNLYYQDVPGTLDEVIDKIDFERLKRVRK